MVAPSKASTATPAVSLEVLDSASANKIVLGPQVVPATLAKIVTKVKNSSVWDKEGQKFSCMPESKSRPSVAAQAKAYVAFFNNLTAVLVEACQAHHSPAADDGRTWSAPRGGSGPLELRAADGTVLAQLLVKDARTVTVASLHQCAEIASAALLADPLRSRYPVLAIGGGDLFLVVADRAGATAVKLVTLRAKYATTKAAQQLCDAVHLLLRVLVGSLSSLGFDGTISKDAHGAELVIVAGKQLRVLETLGSPESWAAERSVVRRVEGADDAGDAYVRDSWVSRDEIAQDERITASLAGMEGVATHVSHEIVQVEGQDDSTTIIRPDADEMQIVHRRQLFHVRPLEKFTSKYELLAVFKDLIDTLLKLYEEKQIHHHNLSLGVLGVDSSRMKKVGKYLVPSGVIMDFCNAKLLSASNMPAFTPSYAYAPVDVLIAMQRGQAYEVTLEDNLKSLFFALLTICLSFDGPDRPRLGADEPAVLTAWRQSAAHALQSRTTVQDLDTFTTGVLDVMAPYFKSLRPCLTAMHAALFKDEDEEQAAAAAPEDALTAACGVARALQDALHKGLQSMKVVPVGVIRRPRTSLGELPAASNIAAAVEEQKEAKQPKGKKGAQAKKSRAREFEGKDPRAREQQPRATRQQPARKQAQVQKDDKEEKQAKEATGKKQAQVKGAKDAPAEATKLVIRIAKRKRGEEGPKEAEDVQSAMKDASAQPAKEDVQSAKRRRTVVRKAKASEPATIPDVFAQKPVETPAVPVRRSARLR